MNYFTSVLIGIDQLANTLLAGYPDETLSSRAYRQRHKFRWSVMQEVINLLFFWQPDHCRQAYTSEIERHQTFALRREVDSPVTD